MKQPESFGSWTSRISAELLTQKSVRLSEPQLQGESVYWLESRPWQGGRTVLMCKSPRQMAREVLPEGFNVRSRVHEYGGGSYLVADNRLFFVEDSDQRIYVVEDGERPRALTALGPWRHTDLCHDRHHRRLLAIREDHGRSAHEPENCIVGIPLQRDGDAKVLVEGHDFFSNPRVSPDGKFLSWLCWDHPNMPWDSSECWRAELGADGAVDSAVKIAGGADESIFQPQWGPDGALYLVSDRSNWWNLYRVEDRDLDCVLELQAEFATPQWVFGMSTYDFLSASEVIACASTGGRWRLFHIDLASGISTDLQVPWTDISQLRACAGSAAVLAASADSASTLYHFRSYSDHNCGGLESFNVVTSSSQSVLPAELISQPQPISFATGGGARAHGFYYPPHNPEYCGPQDSLPPLIVMCHGGPTGATETGLNLKIQYWTSRGFAVADINYRGSTGYGRDFRRQLHGAWGLHDVEDVCAAAQHLVDGGLADPDKLIIKGSSAGGYTVLAALAFADTFKLGCSLYGIGDLETLARDTHKFESRYLDSLVGPYPETRNLYRKRSPLHHSEDLNCPIIFFQGLEDRVVPPEQAEAMVASLRKNGLPVAYVEFADEGHGFRQSHNIKRCLEAEWSFYSQLLAFEIPEPIEGVAIWNLPDKPDQSLS